jgi:uncharacterized membrane protein
MSSPRYQGVDASRGLAMVLMTSTHALRALHPEVSPEFGQWLLRIEPIIPTLFFMLAGWSLARSRYRTGDSGTWLWRHLKRSIGLFALSSVLFFTYAGPQWPESLTSTGVLQCLGLSILIGSLLRNAWWAAAGATLTGAAFVWLDLKGIRMDGINNGSFPLFPFLPIFLAAQAIEHPLRQRSWLQPAIATLGGAIILVLAAKIGFRNLWGDWGVTNTYQEYVRTAQSGQNGFAMVLDLLQGAPALPHTVGFWSTLPRLVPIVVALSGLAILFLCAVADRFPDRLRPLALLGRHSLSYYVGHLVVLGGLGLFLPPPLRSLSWSWLVATLSVIALGTGIFAWLESRGDRK